VHNTRGPVSFALEAVFEVISCAAITCRVWLERECISFISVSGIRLLAELDEDVTSDLHHKGIDIVSTNAGIRTFLARYEISDSFVVSSQFLGFATEDKARPNNLVKVLTPKLKSPLVGIPAPC
jgi:hypothetical protein